MKKIISIVMLILISTLVLAEKPMLISEPGVEAKINAYASQYSGQDIPSPFKSLIKNEVINIYIDDLTWNVITEDGKLTSISKGEAKDATIMVYTSKATIEKILSSGSKAKAAQEALDNKEITYKGATFGKKFKLFFAGIGAKVAGWFT